MRNSPGGGGSIVSKQHDAVAINDDNNNNSNDIDQFTSSVEAKRKGEDVNLSFCGCGFLGIYHVGVASCFHEYAPQLSMHKISGSSAGAMVAMAHICGNFSLAFCLTDFLALAIEARSLTLGPLHPSFDIHASLREALERCLPKDAWRQASHRLHVSLTRASDGKNVVISEFQSNEELIQVLLCTCFIPFWSGIRLPKYKGVAYIDGGFSDNLLILDDKTVTVSPFVGEYDICPQDDLLSAFQISLAHTSFTASPTNLYRLSHALLPPKPEVLSDLCKQGFADGIRFLQKMNLISCTRCLEIRYSVVVATSDGDVEEVLSINHNNEAESPRGPTRGNKRLGTATSCETTTTTTATSVHHRRIILEQQQEQQMIEITESRRRSLFVSTAAVGAPSAADAGISLRNLINGTAADVGDNCGLVVGLVDDQHYVGHEHGKKRAAIVDSRMERVRVAGAELALGEWEREWRASQASSSSSSSSAPTSPKRVRGELRVRDAHCYECNLIRHKASYDPLPKQLGDRFRDACDKVNKSLTTWVYSHRPVKYLSYLMVPYYLPIDLTIALLRKCWKQLPSMTTELTDLAGCLAGAMVDFLRRQSQSSTMVILMDLNASSSSRSSSSSSWEDEVIAYEKKMIKRQDHHDPGSGDKRQETQVHHHHHHHHHFTTTYINLAASMVSYASLSGSLLPPIWSATKGFGLDNVLAATYRCIQQAFIVI